MKFLQGINYAKYYDGWVGDWGLLMLKKVFAGEKMDLKGFFFGGGEDDYLTIFGVNHSKYLSWVEYSIALPDLKMTQIGHLDSSYFLANALLH